MRHKLGIALYFLNYDKKKERMKSPNCEIKRCSYLFKSHGENGLSYVFWLSTIKKKQKKQKNKLAALRLLAKHFILYMSPCEV